MIKVNAWMVYWTNFRYGLTQDELEADAVHPFERIATQCSTKFGIDGLFRNCHGDTFFLKYDPIVGFGAFLTSEGCLSYDEIETILETEKREEMEA